MNLKNKIREYFNKNLVIFDDDINIGDNDDIFKSGYVNSLFSVKLVNFIEKEFQIVIENNELSINNFSTINNISSLIEKKLNK